MDRQGKNNRLRIVVFFRFISTCLLVVPVLIGCLLARPLWGAFDPKPATVMIKNLNMRSGPGRHHPPIATLPKGARVLVLSYEGEWIRVLFEDQTGFIINRENYLQIHEPGLASGDGEKPLASFRHPTGKLEQELNQSREKVAAFSKDETAVINSLEDTEKALDRARKEVVRLSDDLAAMEQRIAALNEQYREVENRANENEQYVAGRLAAFYKLSWLGKFHVLASADSMFDFFSSKRALQQILAHDEIVITQLARDKRELQTLLAQLVAQKDEKRAKAIDLSRRIDAMNIEKTRRAALLEEIRNKKSLQLAAIESLKASAMALDRTVKSLRTEPPSAASSLPRLAEKPFSALKGLLMMPVKGKVISFFGQYKDSRFNVVNFQSGINIKADRGEPVRAVYNGKTLYASWFKGFGNMIIIDHGEHYYSVYARLEEQFKSKGDLVETGEVIATVGDSGALTGAGLHFEIRHHGKPMNPLGWIKKG